MTLTLSKTFLPPSQSDYYFHHFLCRCLSLAPQRSLCAGQPVCVGAGLTLKLRSTSADLQPEPRAVNIQLELRHLHRYRKIPLTFVKARERRVSKPQCVDIVCDFSIFSLFRKVRKVRCKTGAVYTSFAKLDFTTRRRQSRELSNPAQDTQDKKTKTKPNLMRSVKSCLTLVEADAEKSQTIQ